MSPSLSFSLRPPGVDGGQGNSELVPLPVGTVLGDSCPDGFVQGEPGLLTWHQRPKAQRTVTHTPRCRKDVWSWPHVARTLGRPHRAWSARQRALAGQLGCQPGCRRTPAQNSSSTAVLGFLRCPHGQRVCTCPQSSWISFLDRSARLTSSASRAPPPRQGGRRTRRRQARPGTAERPARQTSI